MLESDKDAHRAGKPNGRPSDVESSDRDGEVAHAERTPAPSAKPLARCQHAKAARRNDPDVEVRRRRCRPEPVAPTEPRLGGPVAAVPRQQREEGHEPHRVASPKLKPGASGQAELPG